jgi:hypothetical protein
MIKSLRKRKSVFTKPFIAKYNLKINHLYTKHTNQKFPLKILLKNHKVALFSFVGL